MFGGMQTGFQVEVVHPALGALAPRIETVYVLAEDQDAAVTLVRVGLRLEDQQIKAVRMLHQDEIKALGLKPFQVKHAR